MSIHRLFNLDFSVLAKNTSVSGFPEVEISLDICNAWILLGLFRSRRLTHFGDFQIRNIRIGQVTRDASDFSVIPVESMARYIAFFTDDVQIWNSLIDLFACSKEIPEDSHCDPLKVRVAYCSPAKHHWRILLMFVPSNIFPAATAQARGNFERFLSFYKRSVRAACFIGKSHIPLYHSFVMNSNVANASNVASFAVFKPSYKERVFRGLDLFFGLAGLSGSALHEPVPLYSSSAFLSLTHFRDSLTFAFSVPPSILGFALDHLLTSPTLHYSVSPPTATKRATPEQPKRSPKRFRYSHNAPQIEVADALTLLALLSEQPESNAECAPQSAESAPQSAESAPQSAESAPQSAENAPSEKASVISEPAEDDAASLNDTGEIVMPKSESSLSKSQTIQVPEVMLVAPSPVGTEDVPFASFFVQYFPKLSDSNPQEAAVPDPRKAFKCDVCPYQTAEWVSRCSFVG
jgi:hypothetical protein